MHSFHEKLCTEPRFRIISKQIGSGWFNPLILGLKPSFATWFLGISYAWSTLHPSFVYCLEILTPEPLHPNKPTYTEPIRS